MKLFVSHVNAHQRLTAAKGDFKNLADRMTCSADATQPLSPATPVIAQRAYKQSACGDRDGGYADVQQHRLPLAEAHLALTTIDCWPNLPTEETDSEPPIWHYSVK